MNPPSFKKRKVTVNPRQRRARFQRFLADALFHRDDENEEMSETDVEEGFVADDDDSDASEVDVVALVPCVDDSDDDALDDLIPADEEYNERLVESDEVPDGYINSDHISSTDEGTSSDSSLPSEPDSSSDTDAPSQHEDDFTDADLEALLIAEDDIDGPTELRLFLANFVASNNNVTGATTSRLLSGLKSLKKQKNVFDSLPKDSRTLLKTPRKVVVEEKAGGTYYHFGLEKGIISRLSKTYLEGVSVIYVLINMDGLPLFKSSRLEFWPILGQLRGEVAPFPIGVWCGTGKPTCSNTFLRVFVDEAINLMQEGVLYNGEHHAMKIWGFSCDAPAKSYVRGTKGHTAKSACPRCKTVGVYYRKPGEKGGRETFPDLDAEIRTHQSFIDQESPDHHNIQSILEELDGDMVLDFPFDYMHLACLGVMKKLLQHWMKRETIAHLISRESIGELSQRLVAFRDSIPCELARKPRSLDEIPRWKATEFRQFLMYTGPVILDGLLPPPLYEHFMLLHCALKILSSSDTCYEYNTFSERLLRHFAHESAKLYGTWPFHYV